jgi:hypothetical protein
VGLYLRRLALFPAAWALVEVAENAQHFWDFEAKVRRVYEAGRARGAPPLDTRPSRRQVIALAVGIGAARGLSFAVIRPVLPRRPEYAALIFSLGGTTAHAAGFRGAFKASASHGWEIAEPPSIRRWVRAAAPSLVWRAAVTAGLERLITRERQHPLGRHS